MVTLKRVVLLYKACDFSHGMASFHLLVPPSTPQKAPVTSKFETRIKDLHKIAAMFGRRHVAELFKILNDDLEERHRNSSGPEKAALERLMNMNRYLDHIVMQWSRLAPMLAKRQRVINTGGKMATKQKAELSRDIQKIRNQTSYNKRKLIEMETTEHGKSLVDEYVELLKVMINHQMINH